MFDKQNLETLLRPLLEEVTFFLNSAKRSYAGLTPRDVPESSGLYAIYRDSPLQLLYVGKANKRRNPSPSGQPDALCFRIMKNHLGYQGADNFFRYIRDDLGFQSTAETRAYLKSSCSVQWYLVEDPKKLTQLEHLAIAVTAPRYNRG